MAAHLVSPYVGGDIKSISEAVELFRETGWPISRSTLERQCRARGVELVRHGKSNFASWSALLRVHAEWADGRR